VRGCRYCAEELMKKLRISKYEERRQDKDLEELKVERVSLRCLPGAGGKCGYACKCSGDKRV